VPADFKATRWKFAEPSFGFGGRKASKREPTFGFPSAAFLAFAQIGGIPLYGATAAAKKPAVSLSQLIVEAKRTCERKKRVAEEEMSEASRLRPQAGRPRHPSHVSLIRCIGVGR